MNETAGCHFAALQFYCYSSSNLQIACVAYGSETWHMKKRDEDKLDSFRHKCLRKMLKIHWPMKVTNEKEREQDRKEYVHR